MNPTADFWKIRADSSAEEAEQPEYEKNYDDGPQHGIPPLNYGMDATGLCGRMARKSPVQQNEDSGRDGENRQDRAEAADTQKRYDSPDDEEDGQQEHANVSCDAHRISFHNEMSGGLDRKCIRPPPERMRREFSGYLNRHIPGRSPAAHGRMTGNPGRAIHPLGALPPDFGARQFRRLSGKQKNRRHSRQAADHYTEENVLRKLTVHRALLY
jgi:hypothetical protein